MDLLTYLARNAGRVVPRDELIEAVWGRSFVADATLSHAVAELRGALGDDARRPRFLETITKRGYRLIGEVRLADDDPAGAAPPVPAVESPVEAPVAASVAVLPFVDMSAEHDQEYLCDGVVEEITNALAQVEGLKVAARTSAFAFRGKLEDAREIGRTLGVGTVLEGSVRRAGGRLRITVQLIAVRDGFHLWSERFDGSDDDIFAFEDGIARGVVERLRVKLLEGEAASRGRRHRPNRQAYDLYLRGRYFLNRRRGSDFQAAIAAFEEATVLDPEYVFPYLGLAEAFTMLGLWGFLPPALACDRAKAAAERAVKIDDSLFECHAWLGSALYLHDWLWKEAARHCERALALPLPGGTVGFGLGLHFLVRGERDRGHEFGQRLVAMEPLSAIVHVQVAALLTGVGDHDAAAARLEKALELDPGMPVALHALGFCRAVQGRLSEAAVLARRALEKGWMVAMMTLPTALVRMGERGAALEAVQALEGTATQRYVTPLIRALAWAAVDEQARTLDLLAQSEADRSPLLTLFASGPGFFALAPDWVKAWVSDLRRRIGLEPSAPRRAQGK